MTVFLGSLGNIRLRRSGANTLKSTIQPADVNVTLDRIGFEGSETNLLTGDRLDLSTSDARGLVCFPSSAWNSATIESSISAYVNVNEVGGVRFFATFADAVNNVRTNEIPVANFAGNGLDITVKIQDILYNLLGNVNNYTFNTDRDQIDVTTLSDKFKQQYSAGLLSGSGTLDCFFDYTTTGVKETPLFMLQLLHRVELGSQFDCALYIVDKSNDPNVVSIYYEFSAVIVRSGLSVQSQDVTHCTLDFVTTGDIALKVGEPSGYVLQEDDFRVQFEQSLDFLLQEATD